MSKPWRTQGILVFVVIAQKMAGNQGKQIRQIQNGHRQKSACNVVLSWYCRSKAMKTLMFLSELLHGSSEARKP